MASSQDRTIVYTFKMVTNIQETTSEIKQGTEESKTAIQETTDKQVELKDATNDTTQALTKQQGQLLAQVTALMAVKSAVAGVTNGLIQMGIVSGEDAEKLKMVNAGFQVICGFATGIKALTLAQEAFNLSSLKTSIITTYNSILESPWKLALVGAGVGAAVGVAGALMMQSGNSSSTTTNNIIINDSSGGQVQTASNLTATISGGRVI